MWPFPRSRAGFNALASPSPETTAQLLCRLMEEQNSLLRELIQAQTGSPSRTLRTPKLSPVSRIRTDNDVFRVNRETVLAAERKREEQIEAPWRTIPVTGPGSSPSSTSLGTDGRYETTSPDPALPKAT